MYLMGLQMQCLKLVKLFLRMTIEMILICRGGMTMFLIYMNPLERQGRCGYHMENLTVDQCMSYMSVPKER